MDEYEFVLALVSVKINSYIIQTTTSITIQGTRSIFSEYHHYDRCQYNNYN